MRTEILVRLNAFMSAWPDPLPSVLAVALGAASGAWCIGFADRYSRALPGMLYLPSASRPPCEFRLPPMHTWARHGASVGMALCLLAFERELGLSIAFFSLAAACAALLVLALVDVRTMLLPDDLTLPLLWLGLCMAWLRGPVALHDAVAGAVAGYGFLWLLFWLYGLVRKRDGMGHGDFKLLSALGAWTGPADLPFVLLAACLSAILFALARQRKLDLNAAYPFGPFLAASGVGALLLRTAVHSSIW